MATTNLTKAQTTKLAEAYKVLSNKANLFTLQIAPEKIVPQAAAKVDEQLDSRSKPGSSG